jgi:hypothetical protein
MSDKTRCVLIVGRSASVLVDAVAMLRDRGYGANATNQFDRVLDDYDVRDVDLVIFGGMVPPDTKEQLRASILDRNPRAEFRPGLGGIAPLLVAQAEEFFARAAATIEYDAEARTVRLRLGGGTAVMVEGIWGTYVPPEPIGRSTVVFDGVLPAGEHEIAIPDEVSRENSFLAVRAGDGVSVVRIGVARQPPQGIVPGSLPAPEPVSTRLPWHGAPVTA